MTRTVELPHTGGWCQRWHQRRHSWVPRRRGGFDARRYEVVDLPEAEAKAFVREHHYASGFPVAILRYGMRDRADGSLCGALVLGVPMHPNVLLRPFPHLEPFRQSAELSRLVLAPDVAANGESWFTMQALGRAAREHGLVAAVTFADPMPRTRRTDTGWEQVSPGHTGTVYQACSAVYTGLATARRLTLLPDATVLTARARAKLTARHPERGARGVIARLVALGATPPAPAADLRRWLSEALPQIGAVTLRHPGNHRYLIRCASTPARRRNTHIAVPTRGYPKRDDPAPPVRAALDTAALTAHHTTWGAR